MDIAYIDQLANNGKGYLHKASVISKILLTVSLMVSVVVSNRLIQLLFIFLLLILLNIFNRLPLAKILHFAAYPAFFSLVFAMTRFMYSVEAGFIVILKAVDAAITMILLITTTPYPEIFSFLRLFLPKVVVDGMFFTYRIFFILLEKLQKTLVIIKLRGGFKPSNLLFNVKNLAGVIGVLFIHAFDMSERMYNIYSLRGYEGKILQENRWYKLKKLDYIPIGISIMIIAVVKIL
ncbi:MAG: cobalt/nickel transport system permease protein [Clostridiales bacterium]|jgi:cobalt/nickel transport system permease protein|nr:cobalt/nickel transport system permease protein [Clostridiales bacterium]MDK2934441.1 cobalt/nickel transport system permease protein [Clostridiales bacterium]